MSSEHGKDRKHEFLQYHVSEGGYKDNILVLPYHCSPVHPSVRWPPGSHRLQVPPDQSRSWMEIFTLLHTPCLLKVTFVHLPPFPERMLERWIRRLHLKMWFRLCPLLSEVYLKVGFQLRMM
ncbi:uncharacterized protein M6G45_005680 [Spheniscus humboldti]